MNDVRSHRPENETVVDKKEQRAQPEHDPRGKGAKPNANIVRDVEAEHSHVVFGGAKASQPIARCRIVHRFEFADVTGVHDAVYELGRFEHA